MSDPLIASSVERKKTPHNVQTAPARPALARTLASGPSHSLHNGLRLARLDGIPVKLERIRSRPVHRAFKRLLDLLVGLSVAVLIFPLLAGLALAVKLTSKGPVLFVQERQGEGGRMFRIYKFRSLYTQASDPTGVSQVGEHDARVTPVGRFLRRTSFDELPQLINIIKGDMSLVGPRPHVPDMRAGGHRYDVLVPYYHLRHHAKPGLTGWAQAHGLRGPTTDPARAHARIDHDIAYIANFSFWLDLKILWLTARSEIARFGRGV